MDDSMNTFLKLSIKCNGVMMIPINFLILHLELLTLPISILKIK